MAKEIRVILIFEMLGRPKEHLENTMRDFLEKLGKEQGVKMETKKINPPKKIEEANQEMYTTFAEVELTFKEIIDLFRVIFTYLPSHLEIISPEHIDIKNFELSSMMNELIRKMHQYDEVAKRLSIEREILHRQLQQAGVGPVMPMKNDKKINKNNVQTKKKAKVSKKKTNKK